MFCRTYDKKCNVIRVFGFITYISLNMPTQIKKAKFPTSDVYFFIHIDRIFSAITRNVKYPQDVLSQNQNQK